MKTLASLFALLGAIIVAPGPAGATPSDVISFPPHTQTGILVFRLVRRGSAWVITTLVWARGG